MPVSEQPRRITHRSTEGIIPEAASIDGFSVSIRNSTIKHGRHQSLSTDTSTASGTYRMPPSTGHSPLAALTEGIEYSNLPDPLPPRGRVARSSLSTIVREKSRSKSRARSKVKSPTRQLRQSSAPPAELQQMEELPIRRAVFRPLELSIYMPENQLNPLPDFSSFDSKVQNLAYPAKAYMRSQTDLSNPAIPSIVQRRRSNSAHSRLQRAHAERQSQDAPPSMPMRTLYAAL
ncbi:hypothetical protein K402DRAFT_6614 [Aulographum hederae CBS 113979]|uniref:Uncharacterized protein n=1 Tax=Aulographum hederae CBS 113979 TaxID=1176131 RepID=A0A6G1HGZ8_9PEZI|nr:hypothetical protein K402DRAFT_6614 [Aulographum hederae CBS 113979]